MSREQTVKVTVTLTPSEKAKALELSKQLLGRENLSGVLAYLINEQHKELV
jgi:hypothetical protein